MNELDNEGIRTFRGILIACLLSLPVWIVCLALIW